MIESEVEYGTCPELTADMIRAQLELLVHDEGFRSSKRSVAFLTYVVEQTLNGAADQIKERTIGIEVFERNPTYDTNIDHIVRTAATELRKRLATYYVDEKHRGELRMGLLPGSYVPRFSLPDPARHAESANAESDAAALSLESLAHAHLEEAASPSAAVKSRFLWLRWPLIAAAAFSAALVVIASGWLPPATPEDQFWKPVVDTPGPVLLAVGDHPNGPPRLPAGNDGEAAPASSSVTPVPSSDTSQTVPFADTVTIARVVSALEARKKQVHFRQGNTSSFSDLREGAVVLIGAFNNEWSLRLTRQMRYSLAMDAARQLIYIRDSKNPSSRTWNWGTNQPRQPITGANSPRLVDYALISRIRDSETGHVVVVIGGLYTYGTEAAGEFLTNPDLLRTIATQAHLNESGHNLQIVLQTTVTDGIPGPPKVVTVSAD
jgi:hypothetical protein